MNRTYLKHITKYLEKKIILISGPRQCGKTTLTKMIDSSFEYINFDDEEHRRILREKSWDRKKHIVILDELHKMPRWKQWLKGLYDTEGVTPRLVVTGSARIDSYKKVGDSLAGRYFHYRMHPLDVREIMATIPDSSPSLVVERLLKFGGFPEPYLEGTSEFYNLWKKTHLDIILKQDLIDLEAVKSVRQIELLVDLLKGRVGSPISYSGLAEDMQISDKTVKRWLEVLENLYVIFKLTPYSKNIARSVLKQPKYYFYDVARVRDEGAALENLVAASLLKEVHIRSDCLGQDWDLHFLSKKGSGEIDFCISQNGKPHTVIEVKTSDDSPSKSFNLFSRELGKVKKIQLVRHLKKEKTYPDGLEIRRVGDWLASWT
jgi:predicted AAA+ superfamily ATPase